MRALKERWLRLPRPLRILCNLLVTVVLAVTFYVCIGAPTLNDQHAFRREERANLMGPSTILFNEHVENYAYGRLILAETDRSVITWVNDITWGFNCHEKTGALTLVSAPKWWFDYGLENWEVCLPVFLLDDYPEAVRASITLDIQGVYVHNLNGERLEKHLDHRFDLSAHREKAGFFYFPITLPYLDEFDEQGNFTGAAHGADGYALDALAQTFTNVRMIAHPQSDVAITATVMLYDENDALITEQELVLRTMNE